LEKVTMINEARPVAELIERRLEFETLISDLSSKFINLHPDEVDREIEDALRRVCEPLGIDLAVLWQWSLVTPDVIMPTHVYCAEKGQRPAEPLSQEQFPWFMREMLAGRWVAISSLEELPAEAAIDRENSRLFGVKSNLTLPLSAGGALPVGALGLNTLQTERDWPEVLVNRLQLVAQVFTNALSRKRYEQSLQESEARLSAGAELAGLGFYEVDFGKGTMYVDDRLRHLCGIPPDLNRGTDSLGFWMEHLHADDREHVLDLRQQLHDGRMEQIFAVYRFLHPVQGVKWIQHVARVSKRDDSRRAVSTYGVLRDVTEQKRNENELHDLSRRLIRAHEDERALLARELHDDITQRLAVLAIELGRTVHAPPDGAQTEELQGICGGITRLSEDIHSLAYQLHPSILHELGLAEALRAECERRDRQGKFDLMLNIDPLPTGVGKDAELCLFRVAQEALNNVARHAVARGASVTLRHMAGGLFLAVHDDGVGFDPVNLPGGMHLGMASMRERVRLENGTLDIESAPGRGTTVVAWVPAEGEAR
jgi:signal transduction histidine kinase